ncbi:TetR family transcriptional regulator C-terminal domain-containing protein [Jiella marina]|uniref:TetR family transcriptional regulator C-terminal domain-containing protein n=1 Tax=Jiella sp. LLJ827 TaxID=2917712 RepID=UPI0021019E99|nr:TetR family transcriptional regulator C-terminal domain-containing protein [Jiella sp. LLJ827]MCQ0987062.1 TetR family transcriptional regulator C-terminal domain-containing protein [Jiella sp. LLJ827]
MSRKAFQRLSQDDRRRDLIEATLVCIAQHGLHGATVRRIADQAGVTPGLVRHHFGSKEEMIRNAYAYLVGQLTTEASERARQARGAADAQLRQFLVANMTAPNLSEEKVSLWATFVGRVRYEADFATIHREGYREFLHLLEALIEPVLIDHGLPHDTATCRRHAIALNGLIDGLWVEGSLNSGLYGQALLPDLLLDASERLLGLPANTLSRSH